MTHGQGREACRVGAGAVCNVRIRSRSLPDSVAFTGATPEAWLSPARLRSLAGDISVSVLEALTLSPVRSFPLGCETRVLRGLGWEGSTSPKLGECSRNPAKSLGAWPDLAVRCLRVFHNYSSVSRQPRGPVSGPPHENLGFLQESPQAAGLGVPPAGGTCPASATRPIPT